MTVEFRMTSEFSDLASIARERDSSAEWQSVFLIKPSVNRVVRLRERLPTREDLDDIRYDFEDFSGEQMSPEVLLETLSRLIEVETSYYPLAENLAVNSAISFGYSERIPDFVDTAKDMVARQVWLNWSFKKKESYLALHKRIVAVLRRHLVHSWEKRNQSEPFSFLEGHRIDEAEFVSDVYSNSPRPKPLLRLRDSTRHLSLPSIIAVVDEGEPIEKVATLTVMGYYPDGRGLGGVAKEIGVKRDTLSGALDRSAQRLSEASGSLSPKRSVRKIVEELLGHGVVMKHPSGKNIKRNNPRLKILDLGVDGLGLPKVKKEILRLAQLREANCFFYTTDEIGERVGRSKVYVCRVIKTASESLI